MSREFAANILHPNLEAIELRNLLTWSTMTPGPEVPVTHLKDLEAYLVSTGTEARLSHNPDFFRFMHGVLDPLIGHCGKLTRLSVSSP